MFTIFFTILPFFVCLFWCCIYCLRWRRENAAQHVLAIFSLVCTVLYGCHALFFMSGLSALGEWLWMTCSLAVYPLYYIYILRLTTIQKQFPWACLGLLLPALVVPPLEYFFPVINGWYVRQIFMALIVVYVCAAGLLALNRFEREIHEFYADVDDKSSYSIRTLLIFFTFCSVCSVVFSSIGREFFQQSVLLCVPSALFSVLLFAVFYLGDGYTFMAQEMHIEEPREETLEEVAEAETARWVAELERLMAEEKIFLEPNLKIADVASRAGTCRTYVSNYINQQKGTSFSDYINEQRIHYAQQLLEHDASLTITYLAAATGFASEQSFVRNFRKFSSTPLRK